MDKDTKQALEIIKRGSDEIIPEDAFKKLLTSKKNSQLRLDLILPQQTYI